MIVLGLSYGIYGNYAFLYLDAVCKRDQVADPLDYLLQVLAATMLFEFVAEPITGRFADLRGKKKAITIAYILIALSMFLYSTIGYLSKKFGGVAVIIGAIVAELFLAIGLAFHAGAADAWLAENCDEDVAHPAALELIFARGAQAFVLCLAIGGAISSIGVAGPSSFSSEPWVIAAILACLGAIYSEVKIKEPVSAPISSAPNSNENSYRELLTKLFASSDMRRLLILASSNYVMGVFFSYFAPMIFFLILKPTIGKALALASFPIMLLFPRLLGPLFATYWRKQFDLTPATFSDSDALRYRQILRRILSLSAILMAVFGIISILIIAIPSSVNHWSTSVITVVVLLSAAFLGQASKPIQKAFVNHLVLDNSYRAFAISMTVPFGALIVAFIALLLIGVDKNHQTNANATPLQIGVIFIICGVSSLIAVLRSTRET
jgi:MFS family permease